MANQLVQLKDANNNNLYPTNRPFYDITSQFTVDSEHCSNFKAYTDGVIVRATGTILTGTGDQSNLVTNIPTSLRPTTTYIPGSTFCLNGADLTKGMCVIIARSYIQFRTSSATTGTSGVVFNVMWIIGC